MSQTPNLSELLHLLPAGQLEVITGVGTSGEVSRTPLEKMGHTLLVGGSMGKTNVAQGWIYQLCAKNTPEQVQVAVIDLASQPDLATTCQQLSAPHLAYIATSDDQVEHALRALRTTLVKRRAQPLAPDIWFIVIEAFTELESNSAAWPVVLELLRDGREARMFVMATTRRYLTSGPLHDAFESHMMFAPAPEDTSLDALLTRVAMLHLPDALPILYLQIRSALGSSNPCQRCGQKRAPHSLTRFVEEEEEGAGKEEENARRWLEAVLQQTDAGLQASARMSLCEACVAVVIDQFEQREGVGLALLAQSALFPQDLQRRISFVGFRQVGRPDVSVVCIHLGALDELVEEIRQKGVFDPETCPNCGGNLSLCTQCQQPKCWQCEGEMAAALQICTACWNQYQVSVVHHLRDMAERPAETAQKNWCDTCRDWMPVPHRHKPPRVWRL